MPEIVRAIWQPAWSFHSGQDRRGVGGFLFRRSIAPPLPADGEADHVAVVSVRAAARGLT